MQKSFLNKYFNLFVLYKVQILKKEKLSLSKFFNAEKLCFSSLLCMQKCHIKHLPTQLPWPDQLAIVMRGVIIEKDKENARLMRRQIIRWDF